MREGFVSKEALDELLRHGVGRRDGLLLETADGVFILNAGLRILGRRESESDPYSLTGRVFSLAKVLERGGLLSREGVRFGGAVYDVCFGFLIERASPPIARAG